MWFQQQSGNVIYNMCYQWIRYSLVYVTMKERQERVKSLFICIWCGIKCLHPHVRITSDKHLELLASAPIFEDWESQCSMKVQV